MDRPSPTPTSSAPAPQRGRPAARWQDPQRDRAIYDLLRNTGVGQVISLFNLGEGTKGGPGWMKYKVGNGEHMNIRADTGGFSLLGKTPIPPLTGRDGAPKTGGKGAIDLTIALMYLEGGGSSNPKDARRIAIQRLQEAFHPQTLSPGFRPGAAWKPKPREIPKPPERPKPCDLPAYHEEHRAMMERYLIETRGLPPRMVKHLIDSRLAYPSLKTFHYTDTRNRLVSLPDNTKGRERMAALGRASARSGASFRLLPSRPGGKFLCAEVGANGDTKQMREVDDRPLKEGQWFIHPDVAHIITGWIEEDNKDPASAAPVSVLRKQNSGQSVVMVFPYVHVTEGFATGYEHKEIPRDLKSKTIGYSEGPKHESVVMLGCLNEKTKFLKLTEAPIDAVSKWVLDRPQGNTCIVATIGVRQIPALLEKAKQVGAEVEIAYDCDEAGTRVARLTAKECGKLGVPCRYNFPKESEAVVEIPNTDDRGEERLGQLLAHCDKLGLPTKPAPKDAKDLLRVCVGNTLETWDLFHAWRDEDNLRLADPLNTAEDRARVKAEPKFAVNIRRNKDWNDVLQGLVTPVPPVLRWVKAALPDPLTVPTVAHPHGDIEV